MKQRITLTLQWLGNMKTTKEKTLDAVKIQREIREKISSETGSMTYDEFMKYIEQRVKKTNTRPIGQKKPGT